MCSRDTFTRARVSSIIKTTAIIKISRAVRLGRASATGGYQTKRTRKSSRARVWKTVRTINRRRRRRRDCRIYIQISPAPRRMSVDIITPGAVAAAGRDRTIGGVVVGISRECKNNNKISDKTTATGIRRIIRRRVCFANTQCVSSSYISNNRTRRENVLQGMQSPFARKLLPRRTYLPSFENLY